MKTILHIGINKTGTSTLQYFLWSNREFLSQNGICYPSVGVRYGAHHGIAFRIAAGGSGVVFPNAPPVADDWCEQVMQQAEGHDLLLLSSEGFHYKSAPERVSEYFPPDQTTVVVYLRDHASYIGSWYQQRVESSNVSGSVLDFARAHDARQAPFLRRWIEVFGRDRVIVRHYDRDLLVDRDIVADFVSVSGCRIDMDRAHRTQNKNTSISGNWLFLKGLVNRVMSVEEALSVKDEAKALNALDPTFGGSLYLEEREFRELGRMFRDDQHDVKNEFGIDFGQKKYSPRGHKAPELDRLRYDWELLKATMVSSRKKILHYFKRLPEF